MPKKTVSDDFKVFSERLSALMKEAKKKQEDLAKHLGIKRQTVSLYMNGQSMPDAAQVKSIAEYFNVSADWLLGLSDFRNKDDYNGAKDFYGALMFALANAFDEFERDRIKHSLLELIEGFQYGLTAFDHTVYGVSQAFNASAKCLRIATDSTQWMDSDDDAEKLFTKIDDILDGASVAAYKLIGSYFNSVRLFVMEQLELNHGASLDAGFYGEAQKLLNETEMKHSEFIDNEIDSFAAKQVKTDKGEE